MLVAMAMQRRDTSRGGGWGRQQWLRRVLMDDQDLSGGEKGTSSKSGSISEDHKANVLCELYAAKLTSKCARENSLFWLTEIFPS